MVRRASHDTDAETLFRRANAARFAATRRERDRVVAVQTVWSAGIGADASLMRDRGLPSGMGGSS